MAAVNYYLGLQRGKNGNIGNVVAGTSSGGTGADIELRMQTNNGSADTGLTRLDVMLALCTFEAFINSNGLSSGSPGIDLPVS